MKLPNWFKISWWILLLGITGTILYYRVNAIISGKSVPIDILVFLIFIVLMLVPIFSEIELFGIKLKKEIEELKKDISIKFGDIKNEIRNNQTQTFNATIKGFGPPPPDNKLPELEKEIDRIVSEKLEKIGAPPELKLKGRIHVPDNNILMFKVRYNIENELRRIWEQRFLDNENEINRRYQPVIKIIQDLTKYELIDKNFYYILKEIISICNYAIHGEKVTDKQVKFVSKNAKQVLDYLRQIN